MVVFYFPITSSVQCLVYTFSIPPYWGASTGSITVSIPVGAIVAGSSGGGTYTISGISTTPTAQVLLNGSAFSTPTVITSNTSAVSSKSFAITTLNGAYSMYSYYNSYSFTFTPTQSTTTTYTYTCYLTFSSLTINCTLNTNPAYVPSNYGIVINPVSSTSTLTNATYSSSSDSTGYLSYGYTVNNVFVPATTRNGYAVLDTIYCNNFIQPNIGLGGLNRNTRFFKNSNPVLAETIAFSTLENVTISVFNSSYIASIYLTSGIIASGIWIITSYAGSPAGTIRPVLYDINGTLLASGSASLASNLARQRRRYTFTSAYTIPSSGFYFLGVNFITTATVSATCTILGNSTYSYALNDITAGATTTTILATVGSATVNTGSGATIGNLQNTAYTYTYSSPAYIGLS